VVAVKVGEIIGSIVGYVLAAAWTAAVVAVLVLWLAPISGGDEFLGSPPGWLLIGVGPGLLAVGLVVAVVAGLAKTMDEDGIWETAAWVAGLPVLGGIALAASRAMAPRGWVIVLFEWVGYAGIALGCLLLPLLPVAAAVAFWQRRHA
jgi:hypothetical protein